MEKNEIVGYEPLVNDLRQLIQKKQYHVLQMINSETINLYWEIGEEIYRQQEEKGWGKSIVQVLSEELQKEFPGAKGYSAANLWRMRNFYLTYRESENSHHWCEKLVGAIILSLWRSARMICRGNFTFKWQNAMAGQSVC